MLTLGSASDTTRVLFVGNSYTYSNDLPGMFRSLCGSLGETVVTGMSAPGGYTFEGHTTNAQTQALIAQGTWDFVVLQEQSQLPSFRPEQVADQVLPFAELLVDQITTANACTEAIFLMTWGRENGDQQNCASYPVLCTYEGMQQRLRDSYVLMAELNSARCTPVGAVWRSFRESSSTVLYTDGSHPNALGSYIAASTLFTSIFGRSSEAATYIPAIDPAEASSVRTLASAIVMDSIATWNTYVNYPEAQLSFNDTGSGTYLFANNTTGATEQLWSFGDGATSADFDPLHTYAQEGIYLATLITWDGCGRSDTATAEINYTVSGIPDTRTGGIVVLLDRSARQLEFRGIEHVADLRLTDVSGRVLMNMRLPSGRAFIPLHSEWTGMICWTLSDGSGHVVSGRTILP